VINAVMWGVIGFLHFWYISDFMAYIAAQVPTVCECSQPDVPALPLKATPELVVARNAAIEERAALCKLECPDKEEEKAVDAPAAESVDDEDNGTNDDDEEIGGSW